MLVTFINAGGLRELPAKVSVNSFVCAHNYDESTLYKDVFDVIDSVSFEDSTTWNFVNSKLLSITKKTLRTENPAQLFASKDFNSVLSIKHAVTMLIISCYSESLVPPLSRILK